jgi:PilZ domain
MPAMGTGEQRKYERFPFIADVVLDGSRRCTSSDISEGGIYISAILAFEEGAVIDVTIPFGEEELKVRGEVRHCQQGIGVGIMFVDLDDGQKEKIREMVEAVAEGKS